MASSLKDKAAALRRQHILDAAARAFAKSGYQRTTVRDVAEAAGVADGTIYKSFASKAELLLGLLDPLARDLPLAPAGGGGHQALDPDDVTAMLRGRWSDLNEDTAALLSAVLAEALVDRAFGDAFRTRVLQPAIGPLEEALSNGGSPDPSFAARAAVATFLGLVVLSSLGDPEVPIEGDEVPDRLAPIIAAIVRGAKVN